MQAAGAAVWKKALERVGLPGFSSQAVTSLLLVVTGVRLFFPGTGYGSGVAVFDLSRCTGYKIKVSFGCTGFLALISGNIFVLFTYFSAGQDLGTLCVWLQPLNYEGIGWCLMVGCLKSCFLTCFDLQLVLGSKRGQ